MKEGAAGDIREVYLRAARIGRQQAATTETIRNGFHVAGIVPFSIVGPLTDSSLLPTDSEVPPAKRPRSGIKLGEQVMTDKAIIDAISARNAAAAAKRAARESRKGAGSKRKLPEHVDAHDD